MADITMCEGKGCTKREECYRFTATPNEYRQSYFVGTPIQEDGDCEHFWKDPYAKKGNNENHRT